VSTDKNVRDLTQEKKQAMLFVHLVLPSVQETLCSRTPELQDENVVEHHHA
jgi:hypothetical protein